MTIRRHLLSSDPVYLYRNDLFLLARNDFVNHTNDTRRFAVNFLMRIHGYLYVQINHRMLYRSLSVSKYSIAHRVLHYLMHLIMSQRTGYKNLGRSTSCEPRVKMILLKLVNVRVERPTANRSPRTTAVLFRRILMILQHSIFNTKNTHVYRPLHRVFRQLYYDITSIMYEIRPYTPTKLFLHRFATRNVLINDRIRYKTRYSQRETRRPRGRAIVLN